VVLRSWSSADLRCPARPRLHWHRSLDHTIQQTAHQQSSSAAPEQFFDWVDSTGGAETRSRGWGTEASIPINARKQPYPKSYKPPPPFLHSLPLPFLSFPSPLFSFPKIQLGSLGSAVSSSSGVRGRAPVQTHFYTFWVLEIHLVVSNSHLYAMQMTCVLLICHVKWKNPSSLTPPTFSSKHPASTCQWSGRPRWVMRYLCKNAADYRARGLGSVVSSPAGSGMEPRPKSNLMHFNEHETHLAAWYSGVFMRRC